MVLWAYKIDLAGVLARAAEDHDLSYLEDDCPADVKEQIAAELRKAPPLAYLTGLVLAARTIAAVNRVLDRVYAEADAKRVWCGLAG